MKTVHVNKKSIKKQSGFTIAELLIVVVILGILGTIATSTMSGATDQTRAIAKFTIAARGTETAGMILSGLGTGTSTPGNNAVHANNNLADIIFAGVGVNTTYKANYDLGGYPILSDAVLTMTAPVDGTSAGVYHAGENLSVISIVAPANNREMNWQFTNTTSAEVAFLVSKYDKGSAFNASSADSSGRIRYTAASTSGLHTLTIVNRL